MQSASWPVVRPLSRAAAAKLSKPSIQPGAPGLDFETGEILIHLNLNTEMLLPPFAGNFDPSAHNGIEGWKKNTESCFRRALKLIARAPEWLSSSSFKKRCSFQIHAETAQQWNQRNRINSLHSSKPHRNRTESVQNCKETVQPWSVAAHAC
jgi:hypothetical protein